LKMKEAMYYKKLGGNLVQCELCPHKCIIKNGTRGICRVRENRKGVLYSLVYGKLCSASAEHIEKKPLYHFLPGSLAYSIAVPGCNLACKHCQNWEISQAKPEDVRSLSFTPKEIIKNAIDSKCKSIAYTFTEPSIWPEFLLDICKLAKKARIKNTTVTNGFINPEPLNELCKCLDGSNIDLKSINDEFYQQVCGARLEPVLKAIKIMHEKGVWVELTNLLIPGLNDSLEEINKLVDWVKKLDRNIPLHFTAFYPTYKLTNLPRTSPEILKKARNIALSKGLYYVYTGNIQDEEGNNTYCPKCKKLLIKRRGFNVVENKLKNGKCPCGERIAGVWG